MWPILTVLAALSALGVSNSANAKAPKSSSAAIAHKCTNATAAAVFDLAAKKGGETCQVVEDTKRPPFWADKSNYALTQCGESFDKLNSNQVVTISDPKWRVKRQDLAKWCGKEVKIWKKDGTELTTPEGPFVLWDVCAYDKDDPNGNCFNEGYIKIGMGAAPYLRATGDDSCVNPPSGDLQVQVLANQIWQPGKPPMPA